MRSNTGLKCNLAESAGKQPRPRLSAAALKLSFVSSASHPKNKRHVTFVPRSPIGTAHISALDFNPRLQGANFLYNLSSKLLQLSKHHPPAVP
jgi:hypothetical protein